MFDKFKAAHGGLGPLQALNSFVSGGQGVFGRLGVKHARNVLDSIIEQQQGDEELRGTLAPAWDTLKRTRMTQADLEKAAAGLVQAADDVHTVNSNFADFTELQKRYRAQAISADDNTILDGIDKRGQIAHRMLLSANPKIQDEGRQLFAATFADQSKFATDNETQRIAAESTLGTERWNRFQTTRDDLRAESANFLQQRQAFGSAKALLQSESEASDYGLLYAWNKLLDPGSVVREGEFANAQNLAGVPDIVVTMLNKVRGGERLTPEQRADIFKQMRNLYQQATSEQSERNGRYAAQARDFNVPDQMISDMMIPLQSPGEDPLSFGGETPIRAPDGSPAPNQHGATGEWDDPTQDRPPNAYERLTAALGVKPYADSQPGETGPQTTARRAREQRQLQQIQQRQRAVDEYPKKGVISR